MGIGVSIFLLAIGAILAFAIDVTTNGIDLNTVGVILMVVGAIGLATSFLFLNGSRMGVSRRREVIYDDDPTAARGRSVRERRVVEDEY